MSKPIEEILAPKPVARPRIYAYSIDDKAHKGLLKIGQTTRNVKQRIAEQLKTAAIKNYKIELDESAERDDGTIYSDHEVRAALIRKKFENTELEWVRCAVRDVKTVLTELRTGQRSRARTTRHFTMRREQAQAVDKTFDYFQSIWSEDQHAVPRFLWNAKMRFGKTFTAYQLAKKLGAKRVLVLTFKPAVEDAWQTDLESHVDFDGWQYLSRNSGSDPTEIDDNKPVVYFGSFQDLLGRDEAGNIKPKNEWLHTLNWDLVVFDEYHFGAWRETAKELFEGEEEAVAKKETKLEYATALEDVNEDLGVPNQAITPGNYPANDYYAVTAGGLRTNQGDGRVDYKINDRNSLFGSISWSDTSKYNTPPFQGALDGGKFYGASEIDLGRNAQIGYTRIWSPNLISETRIAYSRLVTARTQANADTDEFKAYGIGSCKCWYHG